MNQIYNLEASNLNLSKQSIYSPKNLRRSHTKKFVFFLFLLLIFYIIIIYKDNLKLEHDERNLETILIDFEKKLFDPEEG